MIGFQTRSWQSSDILSQIAPLLQELTRVGEANLGSAFLKLFTFFLGTPNETGALEMFAAQHSNFKPMEWAGKLQQILECMCPDSIVFERAYKSRQARINLNTIYTPQGMEMTVFQKQAIYLDIRMMYQGFSVPVLDGFYLMLAQAIYRSEPNSPNFPQFDELMLDELYSSLSRNPLLILLRKHLNYLGPSSKLEMKKISSALKLYLTNQVVMKYELDRSKAQLMRAEGSFRGSTSLRESSLTKQVQLKHRLKTHHIHALILMLHFAPEYFSDFSRVCLAYLEYFTQAGGNSQVLQALIRAWIFSASIKKRDNIESQIIKALQKANSKDGWFVLQRESIDSISAIENIGSTNIQVAQSFFKVIDKDSSWSPSAAMLVAFANFFKFLKSAGIFYPDFANTRKLVISDMRGNIVQQKAIRKVFTQLNLNLVEIHRKIWNSNQSQFTNAIQKINELETAIEDYGRQFLNSKSTELKPMSDTLNDLKFRQVNEAELKSIGRSSNIISMDSYELKAPESKKHLVSFYRRDPENVWRAPVQPNQWIILYFFFYAIAKGVQAVTPGKRDSPWLNIRWLANPINFFALLLVILTIRFLYT